MTEETKEEAPVVPPLPSEYYAMVVDSGPIIKQVVRNLMGKAQTYITTPSVLREIRDSKARDHLEHSVMPLLDLQTREPSDKAMQDVIAFAKQTGDYASLSTVDLQVLALTLDLEREGSLVSGNIDLSHIRTTPKRKIGLGNITPMNANAQASKPSESTPAPILEEEKTEEQKEETMEVSPAEQKPMALNLDDYDEVEESDDEEDDEEGQTGVELTATLNAMQSKMASNAAKVESKEAVEASTVKEPPATVVPTPAVSAAAPTAPVKKSWATLVNPTAASTTPIQDPAPVVPFSKMSLKSSNESGGQFDDASEDEAEEESQHAANVEEELQQEFPSLMSASTVPYEGEDDEIDANNAEEDREEVDRNPHHRTKASVFMTEEEKQQNLKPLSKSGRTYNSFRKYKDLMKPKQPKKKTKSIEEEEEEAPELVVDKNATSNESKEPQGSRFLSGGGGGETMLEEDDDGIGWITSSEDIKVMKNEAGGVLDPGKTGTIGGPNNDNNQTKKASGPHLSQRAACATTDFAMQNVLLQMNLILLSTEGMRIRRLKTWVMRCGACFKIHLPDEDFKDETNHHMRRLFCKHCGSDMMQRISASVDGKTGRLKLHFSKRKQGRHHSIRGTKFALPKPGTNNKYKGDLLLREDQLLSGAWNQKVKINSGRKYQTSKSQSMFGRDIASSVGCNVRSTSSASFGGKGWASSSNTSTSGSWSNSDDIRVGFGARKNPNAARGRERRGKKKKSSDRACGMRRY